MANGSRCATSSSSSPARDHRDAAAFELPAAGDRAEQGEGLPRETTEASIEVLRRTVEELAELTTDENRSAVMVVINSYTQRIGRLKNQLAP